MESKWEEGIWLGYARDSNEALIGTEKGVTKAWTVRRRIPKERWCEDRVTKMKGVPQDWKHEVDRDSDNEEIRPAEEGEALRPRAGVEPKSAEEEIRRRAPKLYLRRKDFQKFGCTTDCAGCVRLNRGHAPVSAHGVVPKKNGQTHP